MAAPERKIEMKTSTEILLWFSSQSKSPSLLQYGKPIVVCNYKLVECFINKQTFRSARMEHYLSNFKLGGIWYSFDALQPETRRVSRAREFDKCIVRDGKVSHVIYVLETK